MPYQVIVERQIVKKIKKLSLSIQTNIYNVIAALEENPRPVGSKKLQGAEAWRIRVGDYRIVYEIQDDILIVTVVNVGHRRDVYK
jgi:mRNA interferase RelE/StbE